ncbi:noncanonical pyrimidine nucleotidase, YjjG family [Clostridium sp. 'deep sea']|uniref:YjjG family noncanonical pyrimidine nucleotidase n=1 Tax=Clostridium sp. 'deep sea' TaxID=2779445 RepID=UPI001896958D|nr:YjjG family noncanonical pyrimidine nucleotidase [Clostridium sp. 'deep sea']QOR36098.1 noncanonical pyrimidine nucleotidase, YjjG family [Clostridium sp. 'deep sea']
MKYKGIIFDLDDTVWDFQANSQVALKGVWSQISKIGNLKSKSYNDFLKIYHIINVNLWSEYRKGLRDSKNINKDRFTLTAKEMGVKLSNKQQIEIANLFLKLLYRGQILMPHALSVLEYLKQKYKIGLITNGFANGLSRLESCKIEHFFDSVICSEIYGKPKPDTGIFLHAVEKLKGKPHEFIYVGDNYEGDVLGAKNAGLDAIYLDLHNFDYSGFQIQPNYVIKSLVELKSIFRY